VFNLGAPELIFILVLALLIFGPKKLPQLGRTLGKGMAEFRRASTELQRAINTADLEEPPRRPVRPAAAVPVEPDAGREGAPGAVAGDQEAAPVEPR
jgi:sec-independent protein translocase protein TatA